MNPERPVIRYFGGKWILAPWIISYFPPHKVYVEPFGGAASVLMQKKRSYAEVYNDLCGEIVSLFRILRDGYSSAKLEKALRLTPFARDEFNEAYEVSADPIENARRLIIRAYMGFGTDGHCTANGKTGFRANSNRSGTTPAHDWANFPGEIQKFTERLSGVVIENRPAIEIMKQQDGDETLFFLDPPYVHETRSKKKNYNFEMTDDDHKELLEFIKTMKGMVILCGYKSEVYNQLDWHSFDRPSFADGAKKRTETIWLNKAAMNAQAQTSLFSHV